MALVPMFDVKEYGHIGVFGGSGSGKSTYMKRMLQEFRADPADVYVYTTTGYQWTDCSNNIYDDFGNIGTIVAKINKTKADKKGYIIFDDFNEVLNTQSDQQYIALFTAGRHAGVCVINGAHTPTSMGAKARKNLKYSVIMNTNDMETIAALSNFYLLGDKEKLLHALENKPNKYAAIVIDNETRKLKYDDAADHKDDNQANNRNGTGNVGNMSMGNTSQNYNDCNVMDNSINNSNYNINQSIEIKNMIEANNLKNELSIINYQHRLKLKKMERQEELKNLILKFGKSRDDKMRIASLMNIFITNYTVTVGNYEEYIEPFMDNYYPEIGYKKEQSLYNSLLDNNLTDLYNGDTNALMMTNAIKYGEPVVETVGSIAGTVGKMLGYTPK
jgi:ABC-type oligopeptide transport system ATPase subunit